jgi:tetratricopeptide (TPR) repeat protein
MPFTLRSAASELDVAPSPTRDYPSGNRRRKSDRLPARPEPSQNPTQNPSPRQSLGQPTLALSIALRHQAIAAAQQGYYTTALAFLRQLLNYGAEAQDYNHRGCIYLKMGQPIEAIADFDRAIDLAPDLAGAYLNRGNAVMMTGAYDAALHNYSEALLLNPQDVRVWINRGVVLRNLGLYTLAIQSFDQALRLDSMGGHIYSQRGRTHEVMGDWNCACADYRRALDRLSQEPTTEASRALIHQVQSWLTALIGLAYNWPRTGLA